jgi:alanine adding enzyme
MKIIELTEPEFAQFSRRAANAHFVQSVEFAKLRAALGWQVERLGVKQGAKIRLAGVVSWRANRGEIYLGPLFDREDPEVLAFFAQALKQRAKQRRVTYLTMSPMAVYRQLSQTGAPLGPENPVLIDALLRAGFKRGYNVSPRFLFKKDLTEFPTVEALFKSFQTRARASIRRAENRYHLHTRTLSKEELPLFKSIMEQTAERQGFRDKTLAYYENFYDIFTKSKDYTAEFVATELVASELRESYAQRRSELAELIKKSPGQDIAEKYQSELKGIERKTVALNQLASAGKSVPVSVGLYVKSEREVVYLFGGNDPQYLGFGGTDAHMWRAMQTALENKVPVFNFYGVSGVFDKQNKRYGVLKYKQNFNGYIEELPGGFYLVVRPMRYFFMRCLRSATGCLAAIKRRTKRFL